MTSPLPLLSLLLLLLSLHLARIRAEDVFQVPPGRNVAVNQGGAAGMSKTSLMTSSTWITQRILYRRPDWWRLSELDVLIEYQSNDDYSSGSLLLGPPAAAAAGATRSPPTLWLPMSRCRAPGFYAVEVVSTWNVAAAGDGGMLHFRFVNGENLEVDRLDCATGEDFAVAVATEGESLVLVDAAAGGCQGNIRPEAG